MHVNITLELEAKLFGFWKHQKWPFYKLQENDIHFGFIPFEIFFDSENDWAKVLVQIGILSLRLDWSDPAMQVLS